MSDNSTERVANAIVEALTDRGHSMVDHVSFPDEDGTIKVEGYFDPKILARAAILAMSYRVAEAWDEGAEAGLDFRGYTPDDSGGVFQENPYRSEDA